MSADQTSFRINEMSSVSPLPFPLVVGEHRPFSNPKWRLIFRVVMGVTQEVLVTALGNACMYAWEGNGNKAIKTRRSAYHFFLSFFLAMFTIEKGVIRISWSL